MSSSRSARLDLRRPIVEFRAPSLSLEANRPAGARVQRPAGVGLCATRVREVAGRRSRGGRRRRGANAGGPSAVGEPAVDVRLCQLRQVPVLAWRQCRKRVGASRPGVARLVTEIARPGPATLAWLPPPTTTTSPGLAGSRSSPATRGPAVAAASAHRPERGGARPALVRYQVLRRSKGAVPSRAVDAAGVALRAAQPHRGFPRASREELTIRMRS